MPRQSDILIHAHLSLAVVLDYDQQTEYEVYVLQADKLEKRADLWKRNAKLSKKRLRKAEK